MPRYEFVEGTSSKFWEITLDGSAFTVRYGRLGTDGQVQEKSWPDATKAKAEYDKLVKEKTKKGYSLVGDAAAAAPAKAADAAGDAAQEAKPKKAPKKAAPAADPEPPPPPPGQDGFLDAGNGYGLGLRDGSIVARNDKGKVLASVPKNLKDGEVYEMLEGALEFLENHALECRESVEGWMLRSLPVPRKVLESVWADPDWKKPLENLVVQGADSGILRAVGDKGLGVVTLDGETVWLGDDEVSLPHPILLADLDDWRAILTELGAEQGSAQLFRETFRRPTGDEAKKSSVDSFSGGEFELLATVNNVAKKLGYRVSGGCSICRVLENGVSTEARYYIGEGDPMSETTTGDLVWVDARQQLLSVEKVPPVAFSEGMRMASAVWSKRKIEKKEEADA